jgi:hypothetical protein
MLAGFYQHRGSAAPRFGEARMIYQPPPGNMPGIRHGEARCAERLPKPDRLLPRPKT